MARQLYSVIAKEKIALLQMLVKREEQLKEDGKTREEKFGASIDELFDTRRNELVELVNQYTGQAAQLEEVHRRLGEWAGTQEHNMAALVDRTLEAVSPVATARFQSMLSLFELDLQGLLNHQSLLHRQQAAEQTSELSSSIRSVQGSVEDWLNSIQEKTSSTAKMFDEHHQQLQVASRQSKELGSGLSSVHQTLQQVHSEVEDSLEVFHKSRATSQEAVLVMSEAILLLNATVQHHSQSHAGWQSMLHWADLVLGDRGQTGLAVVEWWLKRIIVLYETSLRE